MANSLQNNAYRILGLDSSVTQKDILKRSKEIINRIKIEDYPEYDIDLELPKVFRNESTVSDSLKKLQSLKNNLTEYFLWFQIANTTDEKAIEYARKKEYSKAIQVWETSSKNDNTTSYFFKKNLAVLYCLLLFKEDNENYLKKSLLIWKEIIDSDKFWIGFSKTYAIHTGQTINSDIIAEFRKNIVKYISDIYTDLYHANKNSKYIDEFQKIFSMTGEKTEKNVLNPIYESIYSILDELQKIEIKKDKVITNEDVAKITKNTTAIKIELDKLKKMGLYDNNQSKIIRDKTANAIRYTALALFNEVDRYSDATTLLRLASKISGTESLTNYIQADLETINKMDFVRCWFCDEIINANGKEYYIPKTFYKVVERTYQNVRYATQECFIPRCKKCESAHSQHDFVTFVHWILVLVIGIGFPYFILPIFVQLDGTFSFIIMLILGILSYFVIDYLIQRKPKGIDLTLKTKPFNYAVEFPLYKQYLAEGWTTQRPA